MFRLIPSFLDSTLRDLTVRDTSGGKGAGTVYGGGRARNNKHNSLLFTLLKKLRLGLFERPLVAFKAADPLKRPTQSTFRELSQTLFDMIPRPKLKTGRNHDF